MTLWRPMRESDLSTVAAIAAAVHPSYPEGLTVFAERLALFPTGCWVCPGGYGIAHPAMMGRPPALNSLLGALPSHPDCLYWHDIAILPQQRGHRSGNALLAELRYQAAIAKLPRIALVAIGGTLSYWQGQGFSPWTGGDDALAKKLASYDVDAAYLVSEL